MRYNGESFEEWSEKVTAFELEQANKRIEKGENVEVVMEEMSKSIIKKLLYPILKIIKDTK